MMYNDDSNEYRQYIIGRDDGYGEGYNDGYEVGYEEGEQRGLEENWSDFIDKESGLIKRTHNYNGKIVHVWVEGSDFKGDRFSW